MQTIFVGAGPLLRVAPIPPATTIDAQSPWNVYVPGAAKSTDLLVLVMGTNTEIGAGGGSFGAPGAWAQSWQNGYTGNLLGAGFIATGQSGAVSISWASGGSHLSDLRAVIVAYRNPTSGTAQLDAFSTRQGAAGTQPLDALDTNTGTNPGDALFAVLDDAGSVLGVDPSSSLAIALDYSVAGLAICRGLHRLAFANPTYTWTGAVGNWGMSPRILGVAAEQAPAGFNTPFNPTPAAQNFPRRGGRSNPASFAAIAGLAKRHIF